MALPVSRATKARIIAQNHARMSKTKAHEVFGLSKYSLQVKCANNIIRYSDTVHRYTLPVCMDGQAALSMYIGSEACFMEDRLGHSIKYKEQCLCLSVGGQPQGNSLVRSLSSSGAARLVLARDIDRCSGRVNVLPCRGFQASRRTVRAVESIRVRAWVQLACKPDVSIISVPVIFPSAACLHHPQELPRCDVRYAYAMQYRHYLYPTHYLLRPLTAACSAVCSIRVA